MRMYCGSAWLLAFIVVTTAILPIPVRADDAQALLAKHKAFVGWQFGDGSITSLFLERTVTGTDGKIAQRASEKRLGLGYRRDYRSTTDYEGDSATGFTGKLFWTTNDNGFTVPMAGDAAKYYLALDVLFMEGSSELPASVQGSATVDGKAVQILRISMNGAVPFDVYEDPDTGAYLKAVLDPGGPQETAVAIHSYADAAPGKKIIGAWSFGDDKSVYAYTKIAVNAAIDPNELHPPAPSATWTFANAQPFPIKVTDSRIYIDAKVNGVPGRFILDTGSSDIAFTDDFANRAHIKRVDKSEAFGIGGETKSLVRKADTIEFGGNTLSNVVVSSLNITFNDAGNFEKPDGLIGFDLFGGAIVNLSLSGGTMTISDPAAGAASPGNGWYPVTPDLGALTPHLPATVDGKFTMSALLDTGAPNLVVLSSQVEDHGIRLLANHSGFLGGNGSLSGVAGSEVTSCGPIEKIQIGPFTYTGTEACESPNWDLHEGLVGFDFLKHFDFVFDYPHGILYLKPHSD